VRLKQNKGGNAGNIVTKQVGILAKMYGRELELDQGGYEYKIVEKGVPQRKKHENTQFFEDILFNETQNFVEFNRIGSRKLDVYTIHQKKVDLSNFDDKKYILDDGITTLAHGHYRIRDIERWNNLPFI
jgi:hypothetical protein